MSTTKVQETYVPVRDEVRHRHKFENDFARVYDVLIPPGDMSDYHEHVEDTLYVCIAPVAMTDQVWGEEDVNQFNVPAGISMCRPHRCDPLIHRVGNIGSNDMHMVGVEVKASPPWVAAAPLQAKGHTELWDHTRMRAYRLSLESQESTGAFTYDFYGVTILLADTNYHYTDAVSSRSMALKAGDVIWHEGPLQQSITNLGESPLEAIVVEWL
ncbi:hypothetical protein R50073_19420 [Maricurvus nonylphenolicus]|uniref:hypothetical protein n=1 Tax=Maricurvus nonylphenolicus TaxID=1008307 RepID=UPI0036F37C64